MAGEKYLEGDDASLARWDSVANAYQPIGCVSSTAYSAAMEYRETVNYCTGGKTTRIPKGLNRTFSTEGQLIDTTTLPGGSTVKETGTQIREIQEKQAADGTIDTWRVGRGDVGYLYFDASVSQYDDNFSTGEVATFSISLQIETVPVDVDPKI